MLPLTILTKVSLGLILGLLGSTLASDVSLSSTVTSVQEGNNLTLVCEYTGSGSITTMKFFVVVNGVGGSDDIDQGTILVSTCATSDVDSTLYHTSCTPMSVSWTILNIHSSHDDQIWVCTVSTQYSNTYTIELATCTCDNKDAICECKTGMIVFTAINYVLDIVYFGIMVWLTLGIRALAKCAPQGNLKSVVLGCATSATIFLDIGLTINLFLNVESAEECCCTNGSKCGHGLRVALAVVGWLLSCFGFALLIRHIAKGGCGGK